MNASPAIRPAALQVEWMSPKPLSKDPINSVQLVASGTGPEQATPLVYASAGHEDRATKGAGYSKPLATSARAVYDAVAALDLTSASPRPDGVINATPPTRDGLDVGQVRVSFRADSGHDVAVRSLVIDGSSATGQALLGAAQNTQRDLFAFMNDYNADRDGTVVMTI